MKLLTRAILLSLATPFVANAQADFESNGSGRWNLATSWNVIAGSDSDGIPDANDNVTILSGDRIEVRSNHSCDNIFINGVLDFGANKTLTVNSDLTMLGEASITGGGNKVLQVLADFLVPLGTAVTVTIDDFQVSGTSFIDGSVTFDRANNDIIFGDVIVASTGVWLNDSSGDPTINGDVTVDGVFGGCSSATACLYNFTSPLGSFSGSGSMEIARMNIDAPASYTSTTSVTILDELTGTGTFTNSVDGRIELLDATTVDITSFTSSDIGSTVVYSLDANRDLVETTDAEFYNLIIDNATGADVVRLIEDVAISNELEMSTGDLVLNEFNLIINDGAQISGGSTAGYINLNGSGRLRQLYSGEGGTLSFPIGEGADYAPINSITINSATFGGANAYLEFDVIDGAHPNRNADNTVSGGDDDGTAAVDYISRYWRITSNNISEPRYSVTYQYRNADIVGNEANMVGTLYCQPVGESFLDWFETGTVNPTNNQVQIIGVI